ncbi:ferritin-like domain-containing protein [Cristinia sonorae]|uniref:Ferritin-like domain-containing protein n=1 Tax=Cristinia sonorae TaxID=1940300 RepID=A0A8K0XKV8_9AGAR|nr:ferritin-like domain-containing protein [Cristinia sonorae]KAH8080734.1 ferritin-like domain-containing protein [Cristinia sonorae]
MLFSTILSVLSGASLAVAAPSLVQRNDETSGAVTDTQVLQYAMTLELLENAFYSEGLQRFDAGAFRDAGFPDWVRNRFRQIAQHEATHVEFLRNALGDAAVQPCEYKFPYNDPREFAALSLTLEVVGQAAYTGAAPLLSDKHTLEVAANILSVEASQAAWVASAVLKGSAWSGPFETALGPSGVFSLAAPFLIRCPESNPQLPVKVLPTLSVEPTTPSGGSVLTLDFTPPAGNNGPLYFAYLNGLFPRFSIIEMQDGKYITTVPEGIQGIAFGGITSSNTAEATNDENLLTGLVVFDFPVPSTADNKGTISP